MNDESGQGKQVVSEVWHVRNVSQQYLHETVSGPKDPLEEMGRIEDHAAEMRTAGLTLDDHILYTIFIDALPAEYEVEARNLASRGSIGRDDIIKAVRERDHRLSGNR